MSTLVAMLAPSHRVAPMIARMIGTTICNHVVPGVLAAGPQLGQPQFGLPQIPQCDLP